MHKRWLYIVVPFVAFGAYLFVRIPLRALWEALRRQDETIVQQTRPRLNVMKRFYGAIIPLEKAEKTWFVKVIGTENEIEAIEKPLQRFLQSIKFTNPDVPIWKLPEGWTEEEPKEKLRYKTIYPGAKEPEVTVSFLPGVQPLVENINRWRGQLGLAELGPFDLEGFYRKETIDDRAIYLVDFTGPGSKAKAMAMGQPQPMNAPRAEWTVKHQAPKNWKEIPPNQFSELGFEVVDGKQRATITVSQLAGDAGGMLANVNRWRGQIGLRPIDNAQLDKDAQAFAVSDEKGKLVDLKGEPPDAKRIVGVILPRGDHTYFFKMTGPSELVGNQRSAFETFMKSVSFER